MGKMKELNEFDRGMIIGTILAGKSVAETAKLLGFSRATVSRVYRECPIPKQLRTNSRLVVLPRNKRLSKCSSVP